METFARNTFDRPISRIPQEKSTNSSEFSIEKENHETFLLIGYILNSGSLKELADDSCLRVRLFDTSYCCGMGEEQQTHSKMFASYLPNVDFFNGTCCDLAYELGNSKFIGYACIVIIVHEISHLGGTLMAIERNRHLRYKSKLILWQRQHHLLSSRTQYHHAFKSLKPDNTIILEWCPEQSKLTRFKHADVMFQVLSQPFSSIQCALDMFIGSSRVQTTNADLYVYSINPALAIIINNYYFTSPHSIREGSEQDVVHLIRELKIAGIPYMIVEDCNREELLEILDYLEQKNFSPIKSILLFLMSHGGSDNVFYTRDGQLDINKDVVERIQANPSLTHAEKLIVVNACRGSIDMEYADQDDLELIQPSANSHLAPSTVVLYGVPNGVQSPRCPQFGCPFIQSFCRHFRNIEPTDDIQTVDTYIDMDLKGIDYFYGLDKCSELVLSNPTQRHNVIQLPMEAMQMLKLIKSISQDFPVRDHTDDMWRRVLYVCGTLNKVKFAKDDVVWKYFAPDLEYDECSVDKDIGNFLGEDQKDC